jgi:hypothetical protein
MSPPRAARYAVGVFKFPRRLLIGDGSPIDLSKGVDEEPSSLFTVDNNNSLLF